MLLIPLDNPAELVSEHSFGASDDPCRIARLRLPWDLKSPMIRLHDKKIWIAAFVNAEPHI
jgi:hypothetical protein